MWGRNRTSTSSMAGGHFRSNLWDPVLIVAQICTMQAAFYFCLGIWIFFLDVIGRFDLSLDQMFTQSDLGLYEDSGRTNIIAYSLNSLTCAFIMWYVVGRTKQCLDFAATVHLGHFIGCWVVNGYVPQTFWWWMTNGICVGLMTILGEFLCMRSEMKAIPLMGQKVDL
ncbi:hypothetical protein C0Q70_18491 [Pomacea canaliculata]|uniref:Protein SYS1 homolog n=2 Tax=Pomacea canaliculata TaxID=400727 RepID=A0A2T7NGN0_POMCA|nr:hypothetical protein C0Q70_18491 [Pomacea canaliculata]